MKRVAVFSGGGAKGAFQAGALHHTLNKQITFDAFFGVSTGALTAAMLGQAQSVQGQYDQVGRLLRVYLDIEGNESIFDGSTTPTAMAARFVFNDGLFTPRGLHKLIHEHIDPNDLRKSPYHFSCGVVQLESGEYFAIDSGHPNVLDFILASASMPVYFPAVRINGLHYVDGGLRNITPLSDAVRWIVDNDDNEMEPPELWIFLASPLQTRLYGGSMRSFGLAGRSLDIILSEVYTNDLSLLTQRNEQLRSGYSFIKVYLIQPTEHYGDALDFDPVRIRRMLDDGYSAEPTQLRFPSELRRLLGA